LRVPLDFKHERLHFVVFFESSGEILEAAYRGPADLFEYIIQLQIATQRTFAIHF